ncbi:MAG: PPC domain-containing protein [Verrucomicrobia bacterium]|nr:PPC domain-containing protein [Verrucomicrobiota bacterium]
MDKVKWLAMLGIAGVVAMAPSAWAQRPYVGFVYPAGGQQGTTFQLKLGGQGMTGVDGVVVSGSGVTARVIEYHPGLGPIDMTLINEQLRDLRKARTQIASAASSGDQMMMSSGDPAMMMSSSQKTVAKTPSSSGEPMMSSGDEMMSSQKAGGGIAALESAEATDRLIAKLEKRLRDYCNTPACRSISSLLYVEVTVSPDAVPGEREIRVTTLRGGTSNPLPFYVGQLPEYCRKPMKTADYQVLGKEYLALRKRPENEIEDRVTIPCTVNGQIASGEQNRYRFEARKGQQLIMTTLARQLIPYLADAVPGWFQPVLTLYDASGKEVAYDDDYRFKPDPIIVYTIPQDGEYVLAVTDAIYRGREDFVYRVTIGETPFITSIFPLGGRVGEQASVRMKGLHLGDAELVLPAKEAEAGIHQVAANKDGFLSNPVSFALDTLPEVFDKEPNNTIAQAQKVAMPVTVNGRIDKEDDWDVFQISGNAGDSIVAEVHARRLDSPVDSVIKLTDANGQLVAFNDDREDLGAGINTHHADSYFMAKLPADGTYFVHIGDTGRKGGEEYGYRLRISAPRPDFALRIMPSSVSVRQKSSTAFTVFAQRKDGFDGPIKITLKDPPIGITPYVSILPAGKNITSVGFKTDLITKGSVNLTVVGTAKVGEQEITHAGVPSEDRMQAFLWRHLVPAQNLKVLVYDGAYEPPPVRVPRDIPPDVLARAKVKAAEMQAKGQKFTKGQAAGRVRQLKYLFEEGLLTDAFYGERAAECECAAQ